MAHTEARPRHRRRVLILDDDPTGTQTASDISVLLRIGKDELDSLFAGPEQAAYVLTNSRSLSSDHALGLLRRVRRDAQAAAAARGESVAFILRGDSTLRGHVFDEISVFATEDSISLLVPAYPDAGRVTVDGIHYMTVDGRRVPVAQTEFARDPIFGYRSLRMSDWVTEVGGGTNTINASLSDLRGRGASWLASLLLAAAPGTVVVPDAETNDDLELILDGLLRAEAAGRRIVVRSAAPLASLRIGLSERRIEPGELDVGSSVLLICGSHTESSTRQLARLSEQTGVDPVFVPADLIDAADPAPTVARISAQISDGLHANSLTILATERIRRVEHQTLPAATMMMDSIVSIAQSVRDTVSAVICKGGITSAAIAKDGFDAGTAYVRGQVAGGVALWELPLRDRTIPYVVVPGNVGDDYTLARLVAELRSSDPGVTSGLAVRSTADGRPGS
jgi:uncharacterized protein YgbK (DUF1537 family)